MPLPVIHDPAQAPLDPLRGRRVAVLGYGNQGSAHALNLRDRGLEVIVANRPESPNGRRARDAGFTPVPIDRALEDAALAIVALPDEVQPAVWSDAIAPALGPDTVIGFLHGLAIHHGAIVPPADCGVVMVAPKGPGATLRARFVEGHGIPALFAVHQERADGAAEARGLAWANGIGCARAAIVRTSFGDEAETDLFGEQAVLCGGVLGLVRVAFATLVRAGYPPPLAYLECVQELKQVTDLLYERGLTGMMDAISNTAEFGAYEAADAFPALLESFLDERLERIRDGRFARALLDDHAANGPWLAARRRALRDDPIERAGQEVRGWFPWLRSSGDPVDPPLPPDR